MTQEYIQMGDTEAAVIDILASASEVIAFSPTSITTDLVGYERGDRWIQVRQQGGSHAWPLPARPRIDIQVMAENRSVAYDIISTCLAVMFKTQGFYKGFGVNYLSCQVETGIFQSSEKDTAQVRYILALRLVVKADAATLP